jgi:hypothetical protein
MHTTASVLLFAFEMTPEQQQHLDLRFRHAVAEQPDLGRLKELLLGIGGDFLVAPPKADPDIPFLLDHGILMSGPIRLNLMESSSCHQNVSSIWMQRELGIVGIATGYALSDDGLWRQHSWGILRDGLLETTKERLKYFGILLQDEGANRFAEANAPK